MPCWHRSGYQRSWDASQLVVPLVQQLNIIYLNMILHLTFLDRMPTTNSTPTHRTPVVSFGKQRCAGRRASTPQPNNQGSLLISTFSTPGMGQENATWFLPQGLDPSPSYPHVWQMISPFLDGEIVLNPS